MWQATNVELQHQPQFMKPHQPELRQIIRRMILNMYPKICFLHRVSFSLGLAYTYYSYDEVNQYYTHTTKVVKENGMELWLLSCALCYVTVFEAPALWNEITAYVQLFFKSVHSSNIVIQSSGQSCSIEHRTRHHFA